MSLAEINTENWTESDWERWEQFGELPADKTTRVTVHVKTTRGAPGEFEPDWTAPAEDIPPV